MDAEKLSGETLAHFQIGHRLGTGGMGIVYRAEDVLLKRPVALKVLNAEYTRDERRRARFMREARTAASLVHPNIATIYEVGAAGETIFIAMELVDGESLRDVLARGSLDLPRAMKWATDIARALAKAHEAGVVHRDLKPDNVMIANDGEVKLLDFGIAKALEADSRSGDPAFDATTLQAMTGEGTVVGTPEYMSPEQARSDRVDARSDVFSFGVVFHEMLTGRSPFRRGNVVDTVVALTRDPPPPIRASRAEVSSEIEALVARCLAKDRVERFADGAGLLAALRAAVNAPTISRSPMAQTLEGSATTQPVPSHRGARAVVIGALVAATCVGGAWIAWRGHRAEPKVGPPASAASSPPSPPPIAYDRRVIGGREINGWTYDLSPDGARIAYVDGAGIWVQELPTGSPTRLPVPRADASHAVAVGFASNDTLLYVVSSSSSGSAELWSLGLAAAAPRRLRTDPFEVDGATFARGARRFAYVTRGGIVVGDFEGPAPRRIVTVGEREYLGDVTFTPAGDGLVYTRFRVGEDHALVWTNLEGTDERVLERSAELSGRYGGAGMVFTAPDRLVMLRYHDPDATLVELPVDARGARTGPARTLYAWHATTVSDVRSAAGRVVVSESEPNGEVVRFPFAANRTKIGAPTVILNSTWVVRPLGWLDDQHVAILEEKQGGYRVARASLDGELETYVAGPLSTAWLQPNGDVLYWTPADAGCSLFRHVAQTGRDVAAPQAGTTCDEPVLCASARCVALEEGPDLVTKIRDWDPDKGATGAPLLTLTEARVRMALAPDGKTLATISLTDHVMLHDLATGASRRIDVRSPRNPQSIVFSPDGARFLTTGTGGPEGTPMFTDAIYELDGKEHPLGGDETRWSVGPRFAADGKSFVVGRANFGARLWMLAPRDGP